MKTYTTFETWGTWIVQEFVNDEGGKIITRISGNGYAENEKIAKTIVADLIHEADCRCGDCIEIDSPEYYGE